MLTNNKIDSFYNKITFVYPLIDLFFKPQKKILFEKLALSKSGRLLDIGVGRSSFSTLSDIHYIIGIDISATMLEKAKQRNPANVELLLMNGEALDFDDNSFDYIVLSHIISVVDNPEELLDEAYRVLKPEGKMYILNHFTPNNWLKIIDSAFNSISEVFKFKSLFYSESLNLDSKFNILEEVVFGKFSYYKLITLSKS